MNYSRGSAYELVVREPLDPSWSEWFDGFVITLSESGETKLVGFIRDQTALHGLLAKIRNLNLTVISVVRIEGNGESRREKNSDE